MKFTLSKLQIDIIERAFWTAVQTFFAYIAVTGIHNADEWKAAAIAGAGAGFSVIKGAIASRIGNKESASTSLSV